MLPRIKKLIAEGSFGDRMVPVHIVQPDPEVQDPALVIMLHGVHGCASPGSGNKYGEFARILSGRGTCCAIVETSRIRRDRETFGTDRDAWARAAFKGKTFEQDHADAVAGTEAAAAETGLKNIWIFGFSLGGIHAILACSGTGEFSFTPSGIALGGTGFSISPEASSSLALPILDTIPQGERLLGSARETLAGRLLSFYGSLDSTFSEISCRRVFSAVAIPEERKHFIVIEGADHSFRTMKGIPTIKPLELMAGFLLPLLGTA